MFGIGTYIKSFYRKDIRERRNEEKYFINFFKEQRAIQDTYDLTSIQKAKKLVVFVIPPEISVYGGMMSFFSLCEKSRDVLGDSALTLIATCPYMWKGQLSTFCKNDNFPNNEKIYRFEQLTKNAENVSEMILHIPEIYAKQFCSLCTKQDIKFIRSVPNLHINILLQNIDLMPSLGELTELYSLSKNITLTAAHEKYATQETSNKWKAPLKHISAIIDITKYKEIPFYKKEKIIVFSPDEHKDKVVIRRFIEEELPDYKIVVVKNMKFNDYMDLITRAFFTITFGEAFDGYFIQPYGVGSMGFSVYNNRFFPDKSYLEWKTVYSSYLDMAKKLKNDVQYWKNHPHEYYKFIGMAKKKFDSIYVNDSVKENLKLFYNNKYDYHPKTITLSSF